FCQVDDVGFSGHCSPPEKASLSLVYHRKRACQNHVEKVLERFGLLLYPPFGRDSFAQPQPAEMEKTGSRKEFIARIGIGDNWQRLS
ncbi:MAG: hypothetical protein SXV54_26225, partial [Chloroflexota bacterium]|nr:hypothetical protein [Chloroflexota bacterium]